MNVLGQTTPDPLGLMLGTDFDRFESPYGIDGLARVSGSELELLAVVTDTPGEGQFRQFITACKAQFESIRVFEIWNDALAHTLERYGFTPFTTTENGEPLSGYRWQRS